jgi:PBP1b-binding outer membrane lipoprotein LpoB
MLKRTLIFLFLIAFFLTACQGQTTPVGTKPPAQETQAFATQSAPTDAASPVPAKTEAPTLEATEGATNEANCTMVSFIPTPNPTEQSLFPAPGDTDWVSGPDTAAMTIYEYSDFQ